jgi:hypothetical protein
VRIDVPTALTMYERVIVLDMRPSARLIPKFRRNVSKILSDYTASCNGKFLFFYKYRAAQKPVNLKHSLLLTRMFKLKLTSQYVERYHNVMSYALNTEDLISNNFSELNK